MSSQAGPEKNDSGDFFAGRNTEDEKNIDDLLVKANNAAGALNKFFTDDGMYIQKFGDGKLIRLLAIADSLHDFRHGYRSQAKNTPQTTAKIRKFLERILAFEKESENKKAIGTELTKVLEDGFADIEEAIKNYFEYEANVPWIVPIVPKAMYTTAALLKEIDNAYKGDAEACGQSLRQQFGSFEIEGANNPIESLSTPDRHKIRDFMITFLFGKKDTICYLTCDSGPNVVKKLVFDSENVHGLIVPQNISDSATGTGRNLCSVPDIFLFPVGSDPLLTIQEASDKSGLGIAKHKSLGEDGVFQSVANNLTGPYGVTFHYKNGDDGGFTDKSDYNWKQILTLKEITGENVVNLEYGGGKGNSGASVDQLLEIQLKMVEGKSGKFPDVKPGPGGVMLTKALQAASNAKTLYGFVMDGIQDNSSTPHSLFMDVKRSGDQDQCLAVHLARKKLTNVALVTGDPTCGIRNRSYDNPTIEQYQQRVRLYRSIFTETPLTEEQEAKIKLGKIHSEIEEYTIVTEFYCNADHEALIDAFNAKVNEKIASLESGTLQSLFYTAKLNDIIAYFESLKIGDKSKGDIKALCETKDEVYTIDFGDDLAGKKENIMASIQLASTLLDRKKSVWGFIQSAFVEGTNQKPKTLQNLSEYVKLIKDHAILDFDTYQTLLEYYPQRKGKPINNGVDIESMTRSLGAIFELLKAPTASGMKNWVGEIDSYNNQLEIFSNGFFNYTNGGAFFRQYKIIFGSEVEAESIRKGETGGINMYSNDVKEAINNFTLAFQNLVLLKTNKELRAQFVTSLQRLQTYIYLPKDLPGLLPESGKPQQLGGAKAITPRAPSLMDVFVEKIPEFFRTVSDSVNSIISKNYPQMRNAEMVASVIDLVEKNLVSFKDSKGVKETYINPYMYKFVVDEINNVNKVLGLTPDPGTTESYYHALERIHTVLLEKRGDFDILLVKSALMGAGDETEGATDRFMRYKQVLQRISQEILLPQNIESDDKFLNMPVSDLGSIDAGGADVANTGSVYSIIGSPRSTYLSVSPVVAYLRFLNELIDTCIKATTTRKGIRFLSRTAAGVELSANYEDVELALAVFNDFINYYSVDTSYFDIFFYKLNNAVGGRRLKRFYVNIKTNPEKMKIFIENVAYTFHYTSILQKDKKITDPVELGQKIASVFNAALRSQGGGKRFKKTHKSMPHKARKTRRRKH